MIAKRLPAAKTGRGGAARYVSGKMPQSSKISHRTDASASKPVTQSNASTGLQQTSDNSRFQTEEEKIAAMFQNSKNQWDAQQQEMAKYVEYSFAG